MRYVIVLLSIVACYLSPLYFYGDDLKISMLVESGIKSGVIVSVSVWASRHFPFLLHIVTLEILLIFVGLVIIVDWHSKITQLDMFIYEINRAVFYFELLFLAVMGVINARAISRDINPKLDLGVLHPSKD